jgi:hypothetical protein
VVKLRKRGTGSNLVDMGWGAVHDHRWVVDSVAGLACRWGGHGEGLRRSRGDAAGAKLGAELIDRFAVNTGNGQPREERPAEHLTRACADRAVSKDISSRRVFRTALPMTASRL